MRKINVPDYDPMWSKIFKNYKKVYLKILNDQNVDIQHVGSTSVEGLAAKPILDIDIIVEDDQSLESVIKNLAKLGYDHVGDLGIKGREAFKLVKSNENLTYKHNLYAGKKDSLGIQNHLKFRNYLRSHPESIIEYSSLKKKLASKFEYDIDSYIDGKTDFIIDILKRCGITERDQIDISNQNKK